MSRRDMDLDDDSPADHYGMMPVAAACEGGPGLPAAASIMIIRRQHGSTCQ